MNDIFISEIRINNVRHLHDMTIHLSKTERNHLLLTGKNGSGKTSLLEAISQQLVTIQNRQFLQISVFENDINIYAEKIKEFESQLQDSVLEENRRIGIRSAIQQYKGLIIERKNALETAKIIELTFNNAEFAETEYTEGNLLLVFFNQSGFKNLYSPDGVQNIEIPEVHKLGEPANTRFIQYMVKLKAQRSFARDANKMDIVAYIDAWFETFESLLKGVFDDNTVCLEFDSDNFNFNIRQAGRQLFDFKTLSAGFSAILNIVTELMMRMEKRSSKTYDLQGIVLIDEIETHLHIQLQKFILPFLTKTFPKIQFIVTSHSPFVLSSISNAVVYDLENQQTVSDMSGFSVDSIIEGYFNADKYSIELKRLVSEYETLWTKTSLTETETDRLRELHYHFKELPKFLAPELTLKIQQIQLSKIRKI